MKAAVIVLAVATLALVVVLALGVLGVGLVARSDGWGMMSGGWPRGGMMGGERVAPVASLEEAEVAFQAYVAGLGYPQLEIHDVMEFEDNYYAMAVEPDTGIGAMELLLEKGRWTVGPEYGPNMMWNARYGMHGRGMMGWRREASGSMRLSPDEAREIAVEWLAANHPGAEPGDADPFYGYYTFHYRQNRQIAGMFSVHGDTGEVWFHNWHGALLAAEEEGH